MRRPWPRCGANLGDVLVARDPAQRRGVSRPPRKIVAIRRPQRIPPQRVLDVGQQQLLVLLPVVGAEQDPARSPLVEVAGPEAPRPAGLDLFAALAPPDPRRPRHHAAPQPRLPRADPEGITVEP